MRKKITAIVLSFIFALQITQIVGATEISVDDGILNEVQMDDINPENVEEENCKEVNVVKVGDNITATLDGTILTLSGYGATYDVECNYESSYSRRNDFFENILPQYKSITQIKFSGNITYIGTMFFCAFEGITEINIPNTVTSLGSGVFSSCTKLEKIVYSDSIKKIPSIQLVEIYDEDTTVPNLKEVIIPEGVTELEDAALGGCTALETLILPSTLKKIGNYALSGCRSIEQLSIPDGVKEIGYGALGSTGIESLNWPEDATSMPRYVCGYCKNLKEVIIPNSVIDINLGAFMGCPLLL